MGKLVLYGIEVSPPVRAVLLTLNALNLEYEFREVDFTKGETRTKDFLKKNPQKTVPVLEDDGKPLWDSHAIAAYLVSKYAKNDELYPKDPYQRAIVDQRLHFDSGVLFSSIRNITAPLFSKNITVIPQEKIDLIYEGLDLLESFLEHDYVVGNNLTIADFSIVASVSTFEGFTPINPTRTPRVVAWIDRMAKLPYYEKANGRGATMAKEMLKIKFAPQK